MKFPFTQYHAKCRDSILNASRLEVSKSIYLKMLNFGHIDPTNLLLTFCSLYNKIAFNYKSLKWDEIDVVSKF